MVRRCLQQTRNHHQRWSDVLGVKLNMKKCEVANFAQLGVVFLKEHRVERIGSLRYFKFFDTYNTGNIHILCDFNSIGTPRRDHSRTGTNKAKVNFACSNFAFQKCGITKEPVEFLDVGIVKSLLGFYRIQRVVLAGKKENHSARLWCDESKRKITDFYWNSL